MRSGPVLSEPERGTPRSGTDGPGRYYADRLDSLRDVFGIADVTLDAQGRLVVAGKAYPIVGDVIVLLDAGEYPPGLRRRLGLPETGNEGNANDIQHTFGAEWSRYPRILPEHNAEFSLYFDLVDVGELRERRVCDLGCGMGRWSFFLAPHCREVVLVDFSEAIFVARENLRHQPNTLFFMADIRQLPFRDDFADLLVSLGVLHHLPVDALTEVRRLERFAPKLLIYLYYALDNRPLFFGLLLSVITRLRLVLSRVRGSAARAVITRVIAVLVYLPLVGFGWLLKPFGLAKNVPLWETYHSRSWEGICQDVYDRFFTRVEQRFSKKQVETLRDTFREVEVSPALPYWHFLCRR